MSKLYVKSKSLDVETKSEVVGVLATETPEEDVKILRLLNSDAMYYDTGETSKSIAIVLLKYYTELELRQYFKGILADNPKNGRLVDRKIYEAYFDYISIDNLVEDMWKVEKCYGDTQGLSGILSVIKDVRFDITDWYNDISELVDNLIARLTK